MAYNYEKVKEKEAKILATSRLSVPYSENLTFGQFYKDFQNSLPQKVRCKNPILHISLNPHPDDKLTNEQLEMMGKEYLQKLGYGEQPFIIFKHEDIAREHIHIVSLRVDTNGKKINDSFEHRRSKVITDDLEEKYGLHKKSESENLNFEQVKKTNIEKGNLKKQIAGVVLPLLKSYHFQTLGEWNALLAQYNVKAEEVKGEHKGKQFTGLLYNITDDKGKVIATPIKSSRIGKLSGAKALQTHFEKSKTLLSEQPNTKGHIKKVVRDTMQFSPSKTDFITALKEEHIGVLFRKNEKGRLYGMTFIDHKEKVVFNGSRLGKEFSANVFNDYFNGNGNNPFLKEKQHLEKNYKDSSKKNQEQNENNEEESLLDILLPDESVLLDVLPSSGIDYKELAFIKKMRRLYSGKIGGRKR